MQSRIRSINLKSNDEGTVLVGEDSHGVIGAVAVVGIEHDPSSVLIDGIAVAVHHRRKEGLHANEAMEVVQQWALSKADAGGYLNVQLNAKCHPRNNASKHLLERYGFRFAGYDDELETWTTPLSLPPRD